MADGMKVRLLISNFLFRAVVFTGGIACFVGAAGATYDYVGGHLYTGQRSNNWNSALSWANGPAEFPNAPGDIARTTAFISGDVYLYLNQDITIGTLNWSGIVLEVHAGKPLGKLIVDNAGEPSVWQLEVTGWLGLHTDLILSNDLRLIITNYPGFGERVVPPVSMSRTISGPGKLILDCRTPNLNAFQLGLPNWPPNTHTGGTRLIGHTSGRVYFEPMKNGWFGTGDVELDPFAKLVLRNRFQTNDYIADTAALRLETLDVTNCAHVYLEAGVNEVIGALYLNDVQLPGGVYGGPESGTPEQLGDFLSGAGTLTVLTGPLNPGSIRNLSAACASPPYAIICGELLSAAAAPTHVYMYWGLTDGGMDPEAWENVVRVGTCALGQFYVPVTGYDANRTLYYRCCLSNALGVKWAASTARLCRPIVQNEPAIVRADNVTFRASILTTGGPPTVLTVFWGRTDGGTNAAAWENATVLGVGSAGLFQAEVAGLMPETVYYYRTRGVNIAGETWAASSGTFRTVTAAPWGDVTFAVASDLHYGATCHFPTADETCRQTIGNMNALPGQPYPTNLGGGFVAPLRGVLLAGDLTESRTTNQWRAFTNDLGLHGERLLPFPVYEGFANHDAYDVYGLVPEGVKARNPLRPFIRNISSNGYHYSFDWDFLHLVCLNVFPGNELDPGYIAPDPSNSLQFLEHDLARYVGNSGRPVVIYHHYGLDSTGIRAWSERQRTNYFNVISNYNVVCIFAGHSHGLGFPTWRGITTCTVGTAGKFDGNFILARVTRTNLVLIERTRSNTWGRYFSKTISVPVKMAISNADGALEVTRSSARLTSQFLMNGPPPVHIYVCWGRIDGGTNAFAWENVVNLGELPLGPFSLAVTNLAEGTVYYYRCFASNQTEIAWAPSTANFRTLDGSINTPPMFSPVPDQEVEPGQTLVVTNTASDAESPPQNLRFTLLAAPQTSSLLVPGDGTCVFIWRPRTPDICTTNLVMIRVSDEDIPALYATQTFAVTVLPPIQPILSELELTNGFSTMKIWTRSPGTFCVETSTNLAHWLELFVTNGPLLPLPVTDLEAALHPMRFYRVRCAP